MEMEPLPGYEYASWETGYGDFRMMPDMATLRLCPWLEKTAMVICDIFEEDADEPVRVAPRQILKDQIAKAADMGFTVKTGSELEFYLFKDGFDEFAERGYRDLHPSSTYIMDYHMLQTTKDEWIIRQIRNHMRGAGIPVEFSKGEFGKGQHEINITYSDALSNADHHSLYKHGVKEIAALNGVSATFMAKWTMDEAGSSCHLHSSIWNAKGTKSLMWSDDGVGTHDAMTYRWYLGGIMTTAREMAWMYAPFVNSYKRYQLASWAPTAIVWSRDNRTAGYRTVGEHTDLPGGVPDPGRRRQPLPGVRGHGGERHVGHREQDRAAGGLRGERLRGQACAAGADQPARGHRRVPQVQARQGDVRGLRVRAPVEHRRAGAGELRQPVHHRLGAGPLLRTRVRGRPH